VASDHGAALSDTRGNDPVGLGRRLTEAERTLVAEARRGTLVTIGRDGWPQAVPACFVLGAPDRGDDRTVIYSPIDEKPKRSGDPHALARVRDIRARPIASLLVDRWDEDWTRLGWVRVSGDAALVEPGVEGHATAVVALRAKYPQYGRQHLEVRPLIAIDVRRVASWGLATDGS
jgi:PPOX class probable F420-dependent enzyme